MFGNPFLIHEHHMNTFPHPSVYYGICHSFVCFFVLFSGYHTCLVGAFWSLVFYSSCSISNFKCSIHRCSLTLRYAYLLILGVWIFFLATIILCVCVCVYVPTLNGIYISDQCLYLTWKPFVQRSISDRNQQ